jgi:hypothetical protein
MTVDRAATRETPNLSYGAVKISTERKGGLTEENGAHGTGTVARQEYEDARPGRRSEKAGPMVNPVPSSGESISRGDARTPGSRGCARLPTRLLTQRLISRSGEAEIEADRVLDDLGRKTMTAI